ncbi:MAG: ApbE family lipoprotein [Thermoleophilia bacterium]|nr:ApbE family lipoprotein [Thermoleophilia bacterium]
MGDLPDERPPLPDGVQRRDLAIMGTFGELLLRADPDVAAAAFDEVERDLAHVTATLTRFDPASPIERLNDAGGGPTDDVLHEVLLASLRAFHDTGGLVDVGVGADVVRAGYDRDFDELEAPSDAEVAAYVARGDVAPAGSAPGATAAASRPAPFELDLDGTAHIRPGVRIDVGGIAKGWAADRARTRLAAHGTCLVNLGGDISAHVAEGDDPWPIGIELAEGGWGSWAIAQGGLATSGQDRRVWRDRETGAVMHHVIDPRTGAPALTDVLRVTVFGSSCLAAEVWTKVLFLDGCDAACERAEALGLPAIVIGRDGATRLVGLAPSP